MARDYRNASAPRGLVRWDAMRALADSLWAALSTQGVSWAGFYLAPGGILDDGRRVGAEEMLLGPCRDKPACSPIGLHGMCGRSWRERRSCIVRDVEVLGAEYVACDPRDTSEVVIPLMETGGACWGVLDLDSYAAAAFDEHDAAELARLVTDAGLSARGGVLSPIVL